MPPDDFLHQLPPILLWLLVAGGVATALLGIGRAAAGGWRIMKTAGDWLRGHLVDVIRGEVPDIVRRETADIREQVYPNSGSSLRDAVDRTEHRLADHVADDEAHGR